MTAHVPAPQPPCEAHSAVLGLDPMPGPALAALAVWVLNQQIEDQSLPIALPFKIKNT